MTMFRTPQNPDLVFLRLVHSSMLITTYPSRYLSYVKYYTLNLGRPLALALNKAAGPDNVGLRDHIIV